MSAHRFKHPVYLVCVSAYIFLTSCSGLVPAAPEPTSNQSRKGPGDSNGKRGGADSNNLDPASWAQRLDGMKANAEKLAADLSAVNNQLVQIFAVKEALCLRQSALISSCIVHTPLSPSYWRSTAACKAERKAWDMRAFNAELKGISGKFQIVLDNSIESNIFESERQSVLQWSSRGSRSLRDLKLSDVGSIKLRAIEGDFKNLKLATFALKIDDKILLTEQDFIFESRTDTAVVLSQIPLTSELSSLNCRVDDNEIDEITQTSIGKVSLPAKISPPIEKKEATSESKTLVLEEWIRDTRREFLTKSDTYLASAQDVSRLRRDLRGELQLGCWGREIIKSIEIGISGSHLPVSDWDRAETRQPLGTSGNPTQTTIDFGGGIRFSNSDENTFALFREHGQWSLSASTDLTIGDISNVQLKKDGYSYQTFKNCWTTWGGLGTACEWQNRESDRYLMNALTIKINGQLIYQKDGLNFAFERNSLNWVEKDLTSNSAYVDLMRRRDCPVSSSSR